MHFYLKMFCLDLLSLTQCSQCAIFAFTWRVKVAVAVQPQSITFYYDAGDCHFF